MDWNVWIYLWITFFVTCRLSSSASGTLIWEDRVRFLREPNEHLGVLVGSSVEIPCLAVDGTSNTSGRRLSVRWMRNGMLADDLKPRANGSLILANVQIQQEAIYQCAVLSTRYGVVLSQRANLTVSKITSFIADPQDVTVSIGGVARFQCTVAANSTPSATYTWFHNDLPLDNHGRRFRILPSGILQIVDVAESDTGSYHCVASNIAGNITSRPAALTTSKDNLALLPGQLSNRRVIQAPENVSLTDGGTAIFECLFESGVNVVWKKIGDTPISSKAYQIGSNLVIDGVSSWDDGAYACVGSRALAKSVTLLAHLSVDSPPEIRKLPEEKLSRRGEWWRFHCDTAAKPAPEIVWYKNGERLQSHGRVKIFPNDEQPPARLEKPSGEINYGRDLLISSMQAEDIGVYQCFASNYLGTTSAAAMLSYLDLHLEGPTNLTANVLSNQREIMVTWHSPSRNKDDYELTVYIVHFHESEAGSENTVAVQQDACHGGVCRTICCSNVDLQPHTNYTFWVDALVMYNDEPMFTHTTQMVLVTSGDAVSLTVAPLLIQELHDSSQVRLSWHEPEPEDLRGQLLEYKLETKVEVDDQDLPAIFLPPATSEYVVNDLPPGVVHFRVIPRTRAGFPELMPAKIYPWLRYKVRPANTTSDDAEAPNLDAHALNATSVFVQWTPINGTNVSKWLISGYRPSDGLRLLRSEVDGNLTSVVLLGLESDTLYQISVSAVTLDDVDGLASMRLIRTLPSASPSVFSLPVSSERVIPFPTPKCQLMESGMLKVHWNTPPMNIVKFAVRYSLLPDDNEPLNVTAYVKQIETSDNFLLFPTLTPGRSYLFAVRAQNADGYKSSFSDDVLCFLPMTKPRPPSNVQLTVLNGSSLLIAWTPSVTADGMGDITVYRVRYSTNLVDPSSWREIIVNGGLVLVMMGLTLIVGLTFGHEEQYPEPTPGPLGSMNNTYLSGLNSSAVYFVSVSAENEAGRSEESGTKAAQIWPVLNGDGSVGPPTTVVLQTSYKEGIIIGACIAIVCAIVCAVVIILRTKRDFHLCAGWFPSRRPASTTKSPTNHLGNGQCKSERRIELAEIQTLLPRLIENAESDSKGGTNFYHPRGGPLIRTDFSMPHPANGDFVAGECSQPTNELITVVVQSPCPDMERRCEQSSDLSRSPATTSSLGSWGQNHIGDASNSLLLQRHRHHGSLSMPNLFDSGIGFDDPSISVPYHTRDRPFSISRAASPRREFIHLENVEVPADSITLPNYRLLLNDITTLDSGNYGWSKLKNGKIVRLRDLLTNGRQKRANGQVEPGWSNSRATSQCTC